MGWAGDSCDNKTLIHDIVNNNPSYAPGHIFLYDINAKRAFDVDGYDNNLLRYDLFQTRSFSNLEYYVKTSSNWNYSFNREESIETLEIIFGMSLNEIKH